ncbi:NB-ARC domain-containing protein [Mycena kentingensis (nom. inval.)]|nr:NB-ARC domain-containing protein [Mycena kentingensis (nom. inval.)]
MAPTTSANTTRLARVLEYTVLAATTLKEIASAGKVPVLSITSTFGLALVKVLETQKTNKEELARMLEHVHKILCSVIELYAIVHVEGSLSPAILFDVAKFTDTLQRLLAVLEEQRAMGRLKQFFKQSEQAAQIQACKAELESSMELFSGHCARMNVTDVARIEMETEAYHENLLALLAENPALTNSELSSLGTHGQSMMTTSSLSLSVLPPPPQIFHGRQAELDNILSSLRQTSAARIAILGTGGMGKTTLAHAVLNHPETTSLFPETQIYFVSCQTATTTDELLATIAAHVGLDRKSRIKRVLQCLNYGKSLLVLDNFETPWEAREERDGVEKLLGQIAELENLALIVTMRGAERPAGVQWTRPFLPPLGPISDSAALELFLDIADEPEDDEQSLLRELLECTGNLPLAITLISTAAADEGCARTLERWKQTKTLVLSDGYDKRSSLEISISLSLTSPRMSNDALELLSLLAILPDGLADVELIQALSGEMPAVLAAKAVLLRTALAFVAPNDRRLKLLVPVREYMATSHPPVPVHRRAMWLYYQKLLELWGYFDSAQVSQAVVAQVSANWLNISNITIDELASEANRGTELEAQALRMALWMTEFSRVSNDTRKMPWRQLIHERVREWHHRGDVYVPYLYAAMDGQEATEVDMEKLIAEGDEYFKDKDAYERARWLTRVANHYQVYRSDLRKTVELRQLAVDTIFTVPYPTPLHWRISTALCHDLMQSEDAKTAMKHARRAHEYALKVSPVIEPGSNGPIAVTLSVLGRCAMGLGDLATAAQYLHASLAAFRGSELEGMQAQVKAESILSVLHSLKSEYVEARLILLSSMPPVDPRHPPTLSHIFTDMNVAMLDIRLGADPAGIWARIEEMRGFLGLLVAPIGFMLMDMIEGQLRLYEGDLPGAATLLRESFFTLLTISNESSLSCAQLLSDPDCGLGDHESTFRWAVISLAFASRIADNLGKMQAIRCLGKVLLAEEDYDGAEILLQMALDDLTVLDVHRWRADCMVQLAAICRVRAEKEKERHLLRAAIPLFERSGQSKDVARVETLLQ